MHLKISNLLRVLMDSESLRKSEWNDCELKNRPQDSSFDQELKIAGATLPLSYEY